MADRYPLIANSNTNRIEELSSGDNLNLSGNSVSGITTITANNFVGNLTGTSSFATTLVNGANILSGTISSQRLSGYYPINVYYASFSSANGLISGTINPERLDGTYNIDITGTASTATSLSSAENILSGTINSDRLVGTYDINVTSSDESLISTTSTNVIGGIASVTTLNVSGSSSITGILTTYEDVYIGGSVGIGTTLPISTLDVRGDAYFSGIVTATDFSSASDIRLKTNINQIGSPIEKLNQIHGVSFDWIYNGKSSMGVIADDLQKVLPELVNNTNPKTVNYNGLIGLLIECVKFQQKEIDLLKTTINNN